MLNRVETEELGMTSSRGRIPGRDASEEAVVRELRYPVREYVLKARSSLALDYDSQNTDAGCQTTARAI